MSSGKTTAANYIHHQYGYSIVSAGETIKELASLSDKTCTRSQLQEFGSQMLSSFGPIYFANKLIGKCNRNVVFEGIRPIEVVSYIKGTINNSVIIYVKAEAEERLRRFILSSNQSESMFNEYMSNPLELNVSLIESISDIVIDNNHEIEALYLQLDKFLTNESRTF